MQHTNCNCFRSLTIFDTNCQKLKEENEKLKADNQKLHEINKSLSRNSIDADADHWLKVHEDLWETRRENAQLKAQLQNRDEVSQVECKDKCKRCGGNGGYMVANYKNFSLSLYSEEGVEAVFEKCPDCNPGRMPHKCPVCLGLNFHPIFFSGEFYCIGCKGTGIVWEPK